MHLSAAPSRIASRHQSFAATSAMPTLGLFDLSIANADVPQAIDWMCARIAAGEPTRIAYLNAHCLNQATVDASYRGALATADALLPDGSGIALAARLAGEPLRANLNGTDLVPLLCARLAATGHSVFLLGGRPGVATAAAESLRETCPGLIIAGTRDGYFADRDEAEVIAEINASGASLVLVAMGVPLQETWLARVAPRLSAPMTMGVGGLFDFLSGRIPRAPLGLRRVGLEWTWRLYQEPARMWRRYVLGNPVFVARALRATLPGLLGRVFDGPAKRLLDVTAAGAGLLLLAPLLLTVAALVRLTSRGPAFLRQTRIGEDGVPFTMFKLRSMYMDAEARRAALVGANEHGAAGLTFKLRRDPRITPIGRLLRKSSIDELPQLWNVLKGEMSLVGPRPQLPGEVARYAPAHFRRLAAKPGLTCLWQISGRADIAFEQQFELDLAYLARRSFFEDLRILLMTVPAVLAARGAY